MYLVRFDLACRQHHLAKQQDLIQKLQDELHALGEGSASMQAELQAKTVSAAELDQQFQQCHAQLNDAKQLQANLLQSNNDLTQLLHTKTTEIQHLTAENHRLESDTARLTGLLGEAVSYRSLSMQQQRELQCLQNIISSSAETLQQLNRAQQDTSADVDAPCDHSVVTSTASASMVPPAGEADGARPHASEQLRYLLGSCQGAMQRQHATLTQVRKEREHFKVLYGHSKKNVRKWHAAYLKQKVSSKGVLLACGTRVRNSRVSNVHQ